MRNPPANHHLRTPPPVSLVRWGDPGLLAAWLYAERLHRGQLRKYTGQPYILHPFAVCKLLKRFGASRDLLKAALLHDVVEECGASLIQLADRFSPQVAQLVLECSRVTTASDGSRDVRHRIELQHLRTISSSAQTLKLADIACNAVSISRRDRRFARVYLSEKIDELAVLYTPSIPDIAEFAKRIVLHSTAQLRPLPQRVRLPGRIASECAASLDLLSAPPISMYTRSHRAQATACYPS